MYLPFTSSDFDQHLIHYAPMRMAFIESLRQRKRLDLFSTSTRRWNLVRYIQWKRPGIFTLQLAAEIGPTTRSRGGWREVADIESVSWMSIGRRPKLVWNFQEFEIVVRVCTCNVLAENLPFQRKDKIMDMVEGIYSQWYLLTGYNPVSPDSSERFLSQATLAWRLVHSSSNSAPQ